MPKLLAMPPNLAPRLVRREAAACYMGISPAKFSELVSAGRLPKPKRLDGCVLWDVRELDGAIDALGDPAGASEWANAT
jgi:predicted DNA-binding transcriptional regulator AlpA